MLKRICAFCLILVLTVSLITAVPVSAASESDISLVIDLGIIDISEDIGLFPAGFNRADFARSLCLMERNDNPPQVSEEEAAVYASDIATNEYCSFIAAVLSAGYMEKDSSENFNPSASITLSDAVTALVKMLGFEPMAQANGGTYDAYYKIALKIGIMDGVSVKDNEKLTSEEVAEMLTNTMGAKMFLPDNIDYGEDCLWDRWHINVHSGKILANSNMGLLIDRTEPGYVNIGGTIYYTELLIENEIVGSNVTYYTMPGDMGDEVVSISVKNHADTLTLKSNEIKSISDNGSILTIKTEDKKSLKIDKKGFLIVNGNAMTPSIAMFNAFESGTATFVDSDNNGVYEVVHMLLLFQTIIDGVNANEETLATRYDGQIISLGKIDNYELYLGDKAVTLSDLSAGMPAGIACDSFSFVDGELVLNFTDAEYVRIYASSRISTGYITGMYDDGRFEIDGATKELGNGYTRLLAGGFIQPLKLGEYVIAYFDNLGTLTYFEFAKGSGMNYGYLIKSGITGSLNKATEVKIMNADGDINIYSTGKNFILDGARVDAGSITYTVNATNDVDLSIRQLVRFRVEDGILKELDTKVVRAGKETEETSLDEALEFNPYTAGNSKYPVRSGAINKRYAFSSDCIIFVDAAYTDDTDPADDDFFIKTVSSLGDYSYAIAGYDSNQNYELECLVRYDSYGMTDGDSIDGMTWNKSDCFIVADVRTVSDKDGQSGWYLSLAGSGGGPKRYFVPEDKVRLFSYNDMNDWSREYIKIYKQNIENFTSVIKEGDIIRIEKNANDYIVRIEKVFDFNAHKDEIIKDSGKSGQTCAFAKLERISGYNFIYSYDEPNDDTKYISARRYTNVPLYHVNTGELEVIPVTQMPSAATGSNVKVFIRHYNFGVVRDIIFYIYD